MKILHFSGLWIAALAVVVFLWVPLVGGKTGFYLVRLKMAGG